MERAAHGGVSLGVEATMEGAGSRVEAALPKGPHIFQAKSPNSDRLRDTVATAKATVAKAPLSKKAFN